MAVGNGKSAAVEVLAPTGNDDREVVAGRRRRRFSSKYKLDILTQTDAMATGEIGVLLRREGLYSSHLTAWRKQRDERSLEPRKRGRKELPVEERLLRKIAHLEKEKAQVEERLRQSLLISEVQKKVLSLCDEMGLLESSSKPS